MLKEKGGWLGDRGIERMKDGWRGWERKGTWKRKVADLSLALIFEEANEKRLKMSINRYVGRVFNCFQKPLDMSIVTLTCS